MFARIFLTVFILCIAITVPAQQKRFSFTEPKMGAPFTIVFYSDDTLHATSLAKRCFNLADSFIFIFSDYIDSSELEKLSASAVLNAPAVPVSPTLLDILVLSQNAFIKSEGAFDITIGPLVKLWRKIRKTKQWPSKETVASIRSLIGFDKMTIDTVQKKVRMLSPGMQLDLGGIAQGYIAQKIIDFLNTQQVKHALVNASGDIVVSGAPPGSPGWAIGVNVPGKTDELLAQNLLMQNKAVTTSGDAYQFMEHAGKRYSHIIDPGTGYGVTAQRNVTVIAADGATADWLATACSIITIKRAKRLAMQMGAQVLITEIKKGKLIYHATKGFAHYWKR
ncbi:MAG: FAD:protein FMN transferase [Ferruginibacter sp.]|nr:FAD:protein FMN transferase [Ferruginibacter sp.]